MPQKSQNATMVWLCRTFPRNMGKQHSIVAKQQWSNFHCWYLITIVALQQWWYLEKLSRCLKSLKIQQWYGSVEPSIEVWGKSTPLLQNNNGVICPLCRWSSIHTAPQVMGSAKAPMNIQSHLIQGLKLVFVQHLQDLWNKIGPTLTIPEGFYGMKAKQ